MTRDRLSRLLKKRKHGREVNGYLWVRGLMAINVGCEFRDRGSITNVR